MPFRSSPAGTAVLCAALALLLSGCWSTAHLASPVPEPRVPASGAFRAGFGRADLTPPPGPGLFAYGPEGRAAAGHRQRLAARALVLEDALGERLVLVSAELGAVPLLLHRRVADALAEVPGIDASRIVIGATHTHAGPGNFLGGVFDAHGSTVSGHDPALLDFLTGRVVSAVRSALQDLAPATLAWGRAPLWGVTRNRSLAAFEQNRPGWKSPYPVPPELLALPEAVADSLTSLDPELYLLRVDRQKADGSREPLGAVSIFAIHGTALPPGNDLYDADIQGAVSRLVEEHIDRLNGRPASGRTEATHLFFDGAAGDVSPRSNRADQCPLARRRRFAPSALALVAQHSGVFWSEPSGDTLIACVDRAIDEMRATGQALAAGVSALFDRLDRPDATPRLARSFGTYRLAELPGLCLVAAAGVAMPGGAGDRRTRLDGLLGIEAGHRDLKGTGCQSPKLPLLGPLQRQYAGDGFPKSAQFSVLRIGGVLVGTVPGEVTTTAGARMRSAIGDAARQAGLGGDSVALITLANGYLLYTTTPEEYREQFYEGASTLYGPGQADAFARVLASLTLSQAGDPAEAVTPLGADIRIPPRAHLLGGRRGTSGAPAGEAICKSGSELRASWRGLDGTTAYLDGEGPWFEIRRDRDGALVAWDGHPATEVRPGRRSAEGQEWSLRYRGALENGGYTITFARGPAEGLVLRAVCGS